MFWKYGSFPQISWTLFGKDIAKQCFLNLVVMPAIVVLAGPVITLVALGLRAGADDLDKK